MTVKERIAALRARMKETGIDAYLIPTDDFHGSEYVGEYFKCRKYITGFTGSAGTAVIMQDMAGLWTDGRYFIQAADQLEGTGITLFKMGEPEVPTVHEFLKKNLTQGMCLGFDGRTVSSKEASELEKMLDENGGSLSVDHDLAGDIWENRPALSCEPVTELDIKWAGESRADKCARIRKAMEKKGADLFVLTSLDDIAWLLNIRGGDIHCCPVVLSYLVMTKTEIRLFANEKAFQTDVLEALEKDDLDTFFAEIIASGRSSFMYLQNVYARSDDQSLSLALCLAENKLHNKGAWRIHGGGFAGTTLNFVPVAELPSFIEEMESVFGKRKCQVLDIRPVGAAYLEL